MSRSCVIYARYSTERQTSDSIDDQLRACRAFAEKNGLVVIGEFKDAALSGAHVDRPEFKRLAARVLVTNGKEFDAILVTDLSRLSRDLWTMGRVVFEDFLAVGVRVIDVATGMASDNPAARTTFAAIGIANDAFLSMVRVRTREALAGRARDGFSAGGRCYGFTTVREASRTGNGKPRAEIVINDAEAEVVRRVFRLYAEGHGFKQIASLLNVEGVRAPYDGQPKANKHGDGWVHSTVRNILVNERYVGICVWNKRKFVRVPGKKNRRAVMLPPTEWVHSTGPAIVTKEDFAAVAARMKKRHSSGGGRGRPLGSGTGGGHLLSGVLYCGKCGFPMGVVGHKKLGCFRSVSRGASKGCTNRLTIPEEACDAAILAALKQVYMKTDDWRELANETLRRLHITIYAKSDDELQLRSELQRAEGAVAKLTDAVANAGWSTALGHRLEAEEARLHTLQAAIQRLRPPKGVNAHATLDEIALAFAGVVDATKGDKAQANLALRAYLGRVIMTPQGEGPERGYRASGAVDFFLPLKREKSSCGGTQGSFEEKGSEELFFPLTATILPSVSYQSCCLNDLSRELTDQIIAAIPV